MSHLDFTSSAPQTYLDPWRNSTRTMYYAGHCETCGRRCYAFEDGENDPRGPLGDHAAYPMDGREHLSPDEARWLDDSNAHLMMCFPCGNSPWAYHIALGTMQRRAWTAEGEAA